MTSFNQSFLDQRSDENLKRFEMAMTRSKPRKYHLETKKLRHSPKDAHYFYEVPHGENKSLKESIERFPDRMCEEGYSFYCELTTVEEMHDMEFFAKFLVACCQCLKSIEFRGHIGPTDRFEYYGSRTHIALTMYEILIHAFKHMPNLETISFYSIRYIPDDPVCVRLIALFISNNNLGKILLPFTDSPMPKIVQHTLLEVIRLNPTREEFHCYRWPQNLLCYSIYGEEKKSDWTRSFKVLKTLKKHFKAQKRLK